MTTTRMVTTGALIFVVSGLLAAQFHIKPKEGKPRPDATGPVTPVPSASQAATRFDYCELVLAWAPNFCTAPGVAASSPRDCASGHRIGFTLRGLWPEATDGKSPESCSPAKPVPRAVSNMILAYMPSQELIRREWEAHGSCTGLTPAEYFLGMREARVAVQIPVQIASIEDPATESPHQVEAQFERANPGIPAGAFRTSCLGGKLEEVRICFDPRFKPMPCPAGAAECDRGEVLLQAPR